MAKYTITNQKELRRSFWEFCKEFGGEFEREANKKKHSFKLDFNKLSENIKTDFVKMALYRKVYTNVQHFINNKLCFV